MLSIKTGYFARLNAYKSAGYLPVSIAGYTPNGIECKSVHEFAPSKYLHESYKAGKINEREFEKQYKLGLAGVPVMDILFNLQGVALAQGNKGVVLLCWEGLNKFCHRHILADYVFSLTGMEIKEFEFDV